MPVITYIDDLKRIYRRRVPKMFYDYAESGSWTEQTFRENTSDFDKIRLRQRVAVDMSGRSTNTQIIGEDVAMPVALAPVGLTGMQHADGEMKAARAAEAFGVPFTLSTMSINSIEDVASATNRPFWFQLYTMRDQEYVSRLIERARAATRQLAKRQLTWLRGMAGGADRLAVVRCDTLSPDTQAAACLEHLQTFGVRPP